MKQTDKRKLIVSEEANQNSLPDGNKDFSTFWNSFKEAALHNDIQKIEKMVQLPFEDAFNDVYNPPNSLTSNTFEEFHSKYDLIFDDYTLEAIRLNNYRGYDKEFGEFGDVIGNNDYLLQTNNPSRSKDFLFKKINDQYFLMGIQYYQ